MENPNEGWSAVLLAVPFSCWWQAIAGAPRFGPKGIPCARGACEMGTCPFPSTESILYAQILFSPPPNCMYACLLAVLVLAALLQSG